MSRATRCHWFFSHHSDWIDPCGDLLALPIAYQLRL